MADTSAPDTISCGHRSQPDTQNPSIILADEPTGNLDSVTSSEIMDLFDTLHRRGHTIILVTHEADIAKHAHRIIKLLDGKIASDEQVQKH